MILPAFGEPGHDCPLCPRLVAFREDNRVQYPAFHNAPVPSFGAVTARLLIVGLAPGLKGANATGRPFTADYAGDLLYATLLKTGLAEGAYGRRADDGLRLLDCRITNSVRCVPPLNKPEPLEVSTCRKAYLVEEIAAMPNLRVVLALGTLSHNSVLPAFGMKPAHARFAHGARHDLGRGRALFDSYHCSRYNTNMGVLTQSMFEAVVTRIAETLDTETL